jgi:putative oxidoreductase
MCPKSLLRLLLQSRTACIPSASCLGGIRMDSLEKLKPLALLLLRVAIGVIFIYHGYPKLFGHTRQAMDAFAHMGFPRYFAYISGVIEFFGGCLLVAGLFTRIAALLLAGEMAVALVQVHDIISQPRAVPHYEFPLALAVGSFALASLGAGLVSFDHALFPPGRARGSASPRKAKSRE